MKGGKGVATGFGGLAAMWPILTIPCAIGLLAWLVTLRLTRYVSIASISATLSLPLAFFAVALARGVDPVTILRTGWPPLVLTAVLAALVVYRHRGNITRVRKGEEPRIGATKSIE